MFSSCGRTDYDTGIAETSCDSEASDTEPQKEILKTPNILGFDNKSFVLSWSPVSGATSYKILYNGIETETKSTSWKLDHISFSNSFRIMAVSENSVSEWSKEFYYECGKINIDGIEYSLTDGVVSVDAYKGSSKNVIVLPAIDGYEVSSISDGAFLGNKTGIERVMLPYSITYIGKNAFADCDDLQIEVRITEGVTLDDWEKNVTIKEGNIDVLDVIKGIRPKIGWNPYV